jgi:hypothetical protein
MSSPLFAFGDRSIVICFAVCYNNSMAYWAWCVIE